ncbi:methylthioribose-1-phosphate isomerase [Brachyspira pilosicoli WesB]|uniref:Methylthioribose-1-phosphate isomerase n=1 Tax=Brachyspira pilosicoli WesB TaxID=1161918 RepID=K0JFT9_BRAPL|nr:S-methyl-5-thioribose-1-phosphate isomerase [Brachyspira pilosicoli]CCG55497.1 methylthioribose-1-phosphate isomerase [Brachyspira pilosicoli WesB]
MINSKIPTVRWTGEELYILDQTLIPVTVKEIKLNTEEEAYNAIKELKVRGAPAIGVAAAYSLLIDLKSKIQLSSDEFIKFVDKRAKYLNSSRPTAVNLSYALNRVLNTIKNKQDKTSLELYNILETEAKKIHSEDVDICQKIGEYGAELLKENTGILTHCNAGRLAVSGIGTALAPMYVAHQRGTKIRVYADETRPLLQGARLTSFELHEAGIDVTLICDNMAAFIMSKGLIDLVIVGCDRVAENGDAANKIGTMGVAILAKHFNIPFYIACPSTTFDLNTKTGNDIVIEERDPKEVINFAGVQTAPLDMKVRNPAFDVTPHELIKGFITEKGIIEAPYIENLKKAFY